MRKTIRTVALAIAASGMAMSAFAGKGGGTIPADVSKKSRNDNTVYAGINWNWGAREGATGVIGFRKAKTKSNNNVQGGKIEATIILSGAPVGFGELKLKGLAGSRSTQGELGLGFGHQGFLATGGVQVPYANAGTDYVFGKGWQPYVGVNTLGKTKRARETLSCPSGYTLNGSDCLEDFD